MNNPNLLEEITDNNARSLKTLTRAIALSQGRFSLILVRCNYKSLRSQILQRLHQESNWDIPELILAPSTTTLYTGILDRFDSQPLKGLMVWDLESVVALDDLLIATNRVRDRFLSFTFPLVLWVTDGVLRKLRRIAPDFFSWMSTPIEFTMPNNQLMALVRENADLAFTDEQKFTLDAAELKRIQEDLRNQVEGLAPEIEAILSLILGLIQFRENQLDEAIEQYQASLAFWQSTNQFDRSGVVLLNIAWAYYLKGKDYRAETRNRIRESIEQFEQANSSDFLANHSRKLGELLRQLGEWESLERIAQKVAKIHQSQGETRLVAQDYSFFAEVALKKDHWQDAKQQAQQGLDLLKTIADPHPKILGVCYFILAKSQRHLGQIKDAIANLEHAHNLGENLHQYDPSLYVEILAELRTLKFEQAEYLPAFNLKLEQIKIENQYGLRAFIGARRLPPAKQMINPVSGERKTVPIEDAIQEFGREKDIEELVERVKRRDRKLTIIYGPSGVGKSSIIEAALIPVLEQTYFEGRDILPILVRLYKDWVATLAQALTDTIQKYHSSLGAGLEDNVSKPQTNQQNPPSVKSIIKQLRQNEHQNLYTVLIFDQFEEFFFDNSNPSSRREFYDFLHQCLEIPYLKVILSLREDYLYYLLEFSRTTDLANFDTNYQHILYYLGNFSTQDAQDIIQGLTNRSQFTLESDLVAEFVKDLAGELGEVRPIEFQVVGTQLETEKITTLNQYRELGNNPKQKLVERFLEVVVEDCGKENERVAKLVLYWLTNENNTRLRKTQVELAKDLERDAKKLDLVLEILVGSGLLLRVPGVPDDYYQLVHDYLVSFIRQKYQAQSLELEEERERSRKFQKRVLFGSVAAALMMTGLAITAGIFGWRYQRNYRELKISMKYSDIANRCLKNDLPQEESLICKNPEIQESLANLQYKVAEKAKAAPPVPANSPINIPLTEIEAVNLINSWLQAKEQIYAPPFNRELLNQYATGKYFERSIDSIEWLERYSAYYTYSSSIVEAIGNFSRQGNQATIDVKVTQDLILHVNSGIDHTNSGLSTSLYRYTLQVDNGRWKIANIEEINN
ncbi:nSTAND1 domain-containing NTPase [Limnofasciculus baicalensis]|uniref:IMS domain-containing protein n=1 Tax=Limnofasciculus baicalensis BBK-W-15 TaxID=2699891 RepID=A0AAE3KRZ1_9CYAN|nr:IMS domain-containing protein [Limnofasciculus baicalensis]MCP2728942.1 IMS domain-containing protein [Limnofasciculus baicalensis BBK-W-15]